MKAAAGPVAKAEAADAADIPDGMPVSGILEAGPGFRQFPLRGRAKVRGGRSLVTMAWNVKRMFAFNPA
ncbi:MAG: hypothetical protein WBD78_05770 [Methylocella sp.]